MSADTLNSSPTALVDTRDKLIAVSKGLFSKNGFDGTSVKEIADAAGVNVSLISYHFGGKEKLYHACLEQFGRARLAAAQRVLQLAKSREEFVVRLEMFVGEFLACHFEDKDLVQIIHRDCMMAAGKMENFPQEIFRDTFLKVFTTLVDFIADARGKGFLRTDVDPLLMAGMVFGTITNAAQKDSISKQFFNVTLEDPAYRDRWVRQLIQLMTLGSFNAAPPTPRSPS